MDCFVIEKYTSIETSREYNKVGFARVKEAIFDWSGKVSMHDDGIDLWAWHCICNGIATPELARALAQTTGHDIPSNNCKNTITSM